MIDYIVTITHRLSGGTRKTLIQANTPDEAEAKAKKELGQFQRNISDVTTNEVTHWINGKPYSY